MKLPEKRSFSFLSLILILIAPLCSQDIAFDYIGVNEGLSQNSATSLIQDNLGRIWIGTRDGLNFYDGTEVKTLRPIRGDSTSLLGHIVKTLVKGDSNHIWIITKNGLSYLNLIDLTFKQYPNEEVLSVVQFKNEIIVGTTQGLFRLDTLSKKYIQTIDIPLNNVRVNHLNNDKLGILWIGTNQGLFTYNPSKKNLEKVLNNNISVVFLDSQKQLWIGTMEDGVYLLNNQNQIIKHFSHDENKQSIAHNTIRDINEEAGGNIWIGTFLGLSIIDDINHNITNYTHKKEKQKSLSHNSIYSILKDYQGGMWVGTYFGGISYYNPESKLFNKMPSLSDDGWGLSYNVIGKILEDKENNLWIATEGGGVNCYNKTNKTIKHYSHTEGQEGLSHNNIKSMAFMNKTTLLLGTHFGGLNILDTKTGQVKTFMHDENDSTSIPSNVVDEVIPFKDYFLLGTKSGVVKFDPKTNQFSDFFKDDKEHQLSGKAINCLLEDGFYNLWIGTEEKGLYCYDIATTKIKKYESSSADHTTISSNNITCIFEDHQFRLWFGTHGEGLNRYFRKEDKFVCYNMLKNNLPSDFIQGIKESRYGNLWISTAKGLSRLDVENNHVYNYSKDNGFPLNELNQKALFLTNDGEVFVGGIEGLIYFSEKEMLNRGNNFNLLLSTLRVNNIPIKPGDNTQILSKDLPFSKEISLKFNQNAFSIDYSACNFITTNKNVYEYKLENYNDEWIKAGNQTRITYTNLNPGVYNLKIKAVSSVEGTVIDEKSLLIEIVPPLFRRWYAIVAYILIVLAISYWLNQLYRARVKLGDKVKAEQREKEAIKKLNQSKLNFFTNISHEFRTPLTLLTGMLQSVLEDSITRPENYRKLKITYNNAIRLNNLITELLNFRKLEHGILKLKVHENNLTDFLEEIYQSFVAYASRHEVNFDYKPPKSLLTVWFDRKQLEKVFYNLLSNAFKFVDDHTGKITLSIQEEETFVDIIIKDNGLGMPEEEIKKIFDPYYQIDNIKTKSKGQGSGIGLAFCKSIIKEHHGKILVNSKEERGTVFTIRLLKGNQHFKESEIKKEAYLNEDDINPYEFKLPNTEFNIENIKTPENAPTILVVEDNTEVLNLIKELLMPIYNIISAENGIEGLEAAIHKQPDLIISDVMMPELSGTMMSAKLKRNIQTSHIPIILLSAKASEDSKIDGLETGVDDYITKPFNTKILKTKVKNIIQNRHLLQQKFSQDPKAKITEITSNSIDQKVLEQARSIIEQNLDNSAFDVKEFAQEMNLGRTRLFAKIKGITGQTPNEFILSTRLKKAAELLLDENREVNVSEIAYSVGFSTPRYFSRCFRSHFGVSPSKYGKVNTKDGLNLVELNEDIEE